METDLFLSGLLEIYRFVPPALLPRSGIEDISWDDFLDLLARARYMARLEEHTIARAISMVFNDDGEEG